jgi:hypothetical protein
MKRALSGGLIAALIGMAIVALVWADEKRDKAPSGPIDFPMREVSIFDTDLVAFPDGQSLLRGQACYCGSEPNAEVKKYPKLKSERPWYGELIVGRAFAEAKGGQTYYFVLDESGEQTATADQESAASDDESLLSRLLGFLRGESKREEPSQPSIPYDRLYIDFNGDGDLTNDGVIRPATNPPAAYPESWANEPKQIFERITFAIDHGPASKSQPVSVWPRLHMGQSEGESYATLFFVSPVARRGEIRIGGRKYDALLAQRYRILGRFDHPTTGLFLSDGAQNWQNWWGCDQLDAFRLVDDRYYTVSSTPLGDKLTVAPYEGKMGLFRLGPGPRKIDGLTMEGSLQSREHAVGVGEKDSMAPVAQIELPVGDYLPAYLKFHYGKLRINVSDNYHADGKPQELGARTYGIAVRADKPFVFDFSNKPAVLFASPAKDKTFARGDEIEVKPVLIDPALDIMIRYLYDTTRKKEGRDLSLDPTVTITRADGTQVAEGVMPFG